MSAKEMEPWLRRFDKTANEQEVWDAAVEKANELAHVKKKLDILVKDYEASGKIASSAFAIQQYLRRQGLGRTQTLFPAEAVPSPLNRPLGITHMHELVAAIHRDGFAPNKCSNAVVHECVPNTSECEDAWGFCQFQTLDSKIILSKRILTIADPTVKIPQES